jgi:hypothetical protein
MRLVASLLVGLMLAAGLAQAQEPGTGWLGAYLKDLTKDEADALGWEAQRGAKLVKLAPAGPAETSGLLAPDDILVSLDGVRIANVKAFTDTVSKKAPGGEVTLTILRAGREMQLAVKLGARPPWDVREQSEYAGYAAQGFSDQVTQVFEKSRKMREEQEALKQKAAGFNRAVTQAVRAIKVVCTAGKRRIWMFISFVVSETGEFQKLQVDGSSGDPECNERLLSALRLVHLPAPPPDLPLGHRTFKIDYSFYPLR